MMTTSSAATIRLRAALLGLAALAPAQAPAQAPAGVLLAGDQQSPAQARGQARGIVFADTDGDGQLGEGEVGLPGVRVSNGRDVVVTDATGRYELPIDDDDGLFVIKPRGWQVPLGEHGLPRHYYLHKPAGSPPSKYPGVAPTGVLPHEIDFALVAQDEPDGFSTLLFGDPQPRDLAEVDLLTHDVLAELTGPDGEAARSAFGVSLGDLAFDDLSIYEAWNAAVGQLGTCWHNVHGNHDMNYEAEGDEHSDETWERVYGPGTYAFDWGPAHFVVLDDVIYLGRDSEGEPRYRGGFTADQLAFVEADLAHVPADTLCVFLMHIPLPAVEQPDREAFLALFAERPHSVSIAAHYHRQAHFFLDADDGWTGAEPHHHAVLGTLCGSWLAGLPDEYGLPQATMSDGTPNGWSRLTVEGSDYALEFFASRRARDFQIAVHAPAQLTASEAFTVQANVFAGSERSTVELEVAGEWLPMLRVEAHDPFFVSAKQVEQQYPGLPGRALPKPWESTHLWQLELPGLPAGTHALRVRSTDMFGGEHTGVRIVRVSTAP